MPARETEGPEFESREEGSWMRTSKESHSVEYIKFCFTVKEFFSKLMNGYFSKVQISVYRYRKNKNKH